MSMFAQPNLRVLLLPISLVLPQCSSESGPAEAPIFAAPRLGLELRGETPNEWLGYSIAGVGDMTGDGKPDLVFSEHASSVGGRVTLVRGPLDDASDWRAQIVATIEGEYGFANLGDWLVHAGGCDVDGDGFNDLLLGSPFADLADVADTPIRSGDNAGKAYIVRGGPALSGSRKADELEVQFSGQEAYDTAGSAIACLGDLDGDGIDELAIAAKGSAVDGAEDAGRIHLFYGRASWPSTLSLAESDATLLGHDAYEQAGLALANVGDVDDDGHLDLLIGAPNSDLGGEDSGVVYLFAGGDTRLSGEVPLAERAAVLRIDEEALRIGWSLAGLGDVDGDGVDDFAIGASVAPLRSDVPGAAWLVLGGEDLRGALDLDLDARGTRIVGTSPGELAGIAVAGPGDVSGDGRADLLIGAIEAEHEGARVGRISMVAGRKHWPATLELGDEHWHAFGIEVGENFGETIVPLGDLDGDERPDFAVTAKGWSQRSGAIRVFFATDPQEAP